LTPLAFSRAAVARQCGQLIAYAFERLGDRRRELAQVAAQPGGEAKRVVRADVGAMPQLELLQHPHESWDSVRGRPSRSLHESLATVALAMVCAGSQIGSADMDRVRRAL